jgi:outer membrane protein OmpA-like peptidoglycan-associated protein
MSAAEKKALQGRIDELIGRGPISFEPDSEALTAASAQTVVQVAALLRAAPAARVEVDGYVAKVEGTYPHTQTLSTQRANRVRVLLTQHGIDRLRITVKGFGDTKPIAPNDTAAGQAANRRVRIVVL